MSQPAYPFAPLRSPLLIPPRYGLYAAATIRDIAHGEWEHGAVFDDSDFCTHGGLWQPCCGRFDGSGTAATRQVNTRVLVTAAPALGGGVEFSVTAVDDWDGDALNGSLTVGSNTVPVITDGQTYVVGTEAACGTTYAISVDFTPLPGGDAQTGQITVTADAPPNPCSGAAEFEFTLTVAEPTDRKTFNDSTFTFSDPFVVYDGRGNCPDKTVAQIEASARNRLANSEQRQVEQMFTVGPNVPFLADDDTVVLAAGDPVSPATAVALLEGCLSDRYLGTGLLHAPAWTAGLFHREMQIAYELGAGPALRTSLGSAWVFGRGYPGTEPEGAPAPDTSALPPQAWVYATGQVMITRSPEVVTSLRDDQTGCPVALAERYVSIGVQCNVKCAVLVDFARCDCPAPAA